MYINLQGEMIGNFLCNFEFCLKIAHLSFASSSEKWYFVLKNRLSFLRPNLKLTS
jgi:hypothetical protein